MKLHILHICSIYVHIIYIGTDGGNHLCKGYVDIDTYSLHTRNIYVTYNICMSHICNIYVIFTWASGKQKFSRLLLAWNYIVGSLACSSLGNSNTEAIWSSLTLTGVVLNAEDRSATVFAVANCFMVLYKNRFVRRIILISS